MMVGDEKRSQLYILSRTSTLDQTTYENLINQAEMMCFDTTKIIRTKQDCNNE